ncbi:hypothetical protein NDU88_005501 [Pleurodeles waltl]|uniref:Myb/SANT-like DNA-binding domain-containing protein n=1 Tax=Pleurodeles waltl TaxID=8319 RepID=A0AAV7X1D9_PLEWA|nr:hypothetical protein NDU88_005501 [Pleurodeles waltl]
MTPQVLRGGAKGHGGGNHPGRATAIRITGAADIIPRKMELWRRIVDKVNAVGQQPRTRDDIRKRWNDLQGKVPHPSPERRCQPHPVTEEAHSDDSSSAHLDLDNQPGPSGVSGQSVTQTQSHTTTEPPPSGNTTIAPTQQAHTSVPRTRQSDSVSTTSGTPGNPTNTGRSGTWVQWQWAHSSGDRGTGQQGSWENCCVTGEDRPREPSLQEALTNILGAYHHSQETMGQILVKLQETQWLQEGQYLGIREDLKDIHTTLVTIAGVLADMANTTVPLTLATPMNSPPPPLSLLLVDRRPRHRNNRPPAPLPLQKENQTVPVIQAEAREHCQDPVRK